MHCGKKLHASTTTAMISLQQQTATFQKTKADSVRILSVDLSKALDRVQHHIVIETLSQVTPEINPFIINWVASFLKNRLVFTECNNRKSRTAIISQGVPQGTVLGPILFNIATSEIDIEPVNTAEIIKFADDSYTIIPVYGSQDDSRNAMQHIKQWCSDNDFHVNDKKSKL